MDESDCYRVGRIIKPFGYKGEMIFYFSSGHPEDYQSIRSVFIDIDHELVPFFIEEFIVRDEHTALVRLEDILSDDHAKKLINSSLFLPRSDYILQENPLSHQSMVGFQVYDQSHGYIGDVTEMIRYRQQELLKVRHEDKEWLIPAVEELIVSIDPGKKHIHMDLPEGLLEINR